MFYRWQKEVRYLSVLQGYKAERNYIKPCLCSFKAITLPPVAQLGSPGPLPSGGRSPTCALTRMGSTSCPSGMTERFILAMLSRVSSAACVFPVETLKRADSGINWAQITKDIRAAGTIGWQGAVGCCCCYFRPPGCLPYPGGVASLKASNISGILINSMLTWKFASMEGNLGNLRVWTKTKGPTLDNIWIEYRFLFSFSQIH